jgi:hypothetical protein
MVLLSIDPCLQLENFNENKRQNIISKYGDLRVKAAVEIKKMWFNLGNLTFLKLFTFFFSLINLII